MPASFHWPFRKKDIVASEDSLSGRVSAAHDSEPAQPSRATTEEARTPTPTIKILEDEGVPFGIKVLVDRDGKEPDCVDIVAVHGLNGHREKTWRASTTGLNWLSDEQCLQKDIPNARVLAFGYNSRTYFSRSDSDVRDFASELLAALQANRRTDVERKRPIVFVCHSLGGLVFKQVCSGMGMRRSKSVWY